MGGRGEISKTFNNKDYKKNLWGELSPDYVT